MAIAASDITLLRGDLRGVVTAIALSCDRWSARVKASSPTAAFDITACTKPVPSRMIRKWIFPLDRRFDSQPSMVTAWPSYLEIS